MNNNDYIEKISYYICGCMEEKSILKLQKLLYLCQAKALIERGLHNPLFKNDFYAGKYHPIIKEIYFNEGVMYYDNQNIKINEEDRKIIDKVLLEHGKKNIINIITFSPICKEPKGFGSNKNYMKEYFSIQNLISKKSIYDYYYKGE